MRLSIFVSCRTKSKSAPKEETTHPKLKEKSCSSQIWWITQKIVYSSFCYSNSISVFFFWNVKPQKTRSINDSTPQFPSMISLWRFNVIFSWKSRCLIIISDWCWSIGIVWVFFLNHHRSAFCNNGWVKCRVYIVLRLNVGITLIDVHHPYKTSTMAPIFQNFLWMYCKKRMNLNVFIIQWCWKWNQKKKQLQLFELGRTRD